MVYTAEMVLRQALAKFDEDDLDDYKLSGIESLNTCLAEIFEINNGRRERKGLEPLKEIPYIINLSDTVPYEDEVIRQCLKYGVASDMYWKDGDDETHYMYHEKYIRGKNDLKTVRVVRSKWNI